MESSEQRDEYLASDEYLVQCIRAIAVVASQPAVSDTALVAVWRAYRVATPEASVR